MLVVRVSLIVRITLTAKVASTIRGKIDRRDHVFISKIDSRSIVDHVPNRRKFRKGDELLVLGLHVCLCFHFISRHGTRKRGESENKDHARNHECHSSFGGQLAPKGEIAYEAEYGRSRGFSVDEDCPECLVRHRSTLHGGCNIYGEYSPGYKSESCLSKTANDL